MWYLNFCSPIDHYLSWNRRIMAINLIIMMLIYIIFKIIYQLCYFQQKKTAVSDTGEQIIKTQNQNCDKIKQENSKNEELTKNNVCCENFLYNIKELNQYYSTLYGHHVVAVLFSIIYSPYLTQIILSYIYTFLGLSFIILSYFQKSNWTKLCWGLMCFINLFLMQSGFVRLGLTNYDAKNGACYDVLYG